MNPKTFIFFGPPGCGKGTQIKLLTDLLNQKSSNGLVYGYPGQEFRKLVESGNYTGATLKDSMERGLLLPDFLPDAMFSDILIRDLTAEKHLIADGYPRSINQSEKFEQMMTFYQRSDKKIIFISLTVEETIKRNSLRGRPDDGSEEVIKTRFNEYTRKIIPSMEYFRNKPDYEFIEINGEQSVEDVHKDIIKALNL